ncbi:D-TA family PLP-dependent enzyme [Echinicola rosea]|uniref:Threonine aldolase n=1 Tax=Echinicola rosea TaxID=1807691 RepID=A0ABQ1UIG1_9BACT|nr:D-TA family PLP-dependent enzyme [Echinicola rosea]GGF18648.1 threonine aldolase [Echinicola rosea]
MDWYEIKDVEAIDSPVLAVYPKRVKSNIGRLKSMVKEVSQLQPHIKTVKCLEVVKMLMDAGIDKFKCATIAEAEMLGMAGAKEVLIAYPMVGPKVDRMIKLMLVYQDTEFSCLVDCPEQARHLSAHTYQADVYLRVFMDLNVGTDRTGVRPLAEAKELYDYCKATSHLITMGLHIYDGHIRHQDFEQRKEACQAAFAPVETLAKWAREKYPVELKVIAGGSPTFPVHAEREAVTCSPGTFAYWDKGYQESLPEQSFDFAAVLMTRVISRPGKNLLCLDLGYKSVASEGPLEKRVWFPEYPSWAMVSHSEEHLVVKVPEGEVLPVGNVVYAIPYHICPTVAMYDKVLTVENNKVAGEWKTLARKRRINI